ncbi:PepSY domain-containing protein [Devosia sp.]|uniref:PepSY domain-containing protein n=1 Tax=Devosia sp. TaxID=1871048 RepID=UPI002F07D20D
MKTPLAALAVLAGTFLASPAFAATATPAAPTAAPAANACALPAGTVAQSRDALRQKLQAEGWQVRRIKRADGCYRVVAVKADGTRLRARFNAATLEEVPAPAPAAAPAPASAPAAAAAGGSVDAFLANLQGASGTATACGDDDDDDDDDDHDDRRRRFRDHDDD